MFAVYLEAGPNGCQKEKKLVFVVLCRLWYWFHYNVELIEKTISIYLVSNNTYFWINDMSK